MPETLEDHILAIVKRVFPEHAEYHLGLESDDICINVGWKLDNDSSRPNKQSKTLKIRISREAIDDYKASNIHNRNSADERLQGTLTAQLQDFDPDHNVPAHMSPPVVQWTITTAMLNS